MPLAWIVFRQERDVSSPCMEDAFPAAAESSVFESVLGLPSILSGLVLARL